MSLSLQPVPVGQRLQRNLGVCQRVRKTQVHGALLPVNLRSDRRMQLPQATLYRICQTDATDTTTTGR